MSTQPTEVMTSGYGIIPAAPGWWAHENDVTGEPIGEWYAVAAWLAPAVSTAAEVVLLPLVAPPSSGGVASWGIADEWHIVYSPHGTPVPPCVNCAALARTG